MTEKVKITVMSIANDCLNIYSEKIAKQVKFSTSLDGTIVSCLMKYISRNQLRFEVFQCSQT